MARCLTHCRRCLIPFVADARNAGRLANLLCPFGCSERHRKSESARRSAEYRQTPEGKEKKRQINARRNSKKNRATDPSITLPATSDSLPTSPNPPPAPSQSEPQRPKIPKPSPVHIYIRRVVSAIERRPFTWLEVAELIDRVVSQHNMGKSRRHDRIRRWLDALRP